ncbi:hypothetical protein COLO4_21099 [Corchorus olitorius]|uniref:RRM domain-containing protein n=1 Tax=Corchorus olitorius TaxID=93759 RepID=A0A1R3IVF3_9ROSI|nr:hypothetical protein COLO4_21099 [Corchorus olitorius]
MGDPYYRYTAAAGDTGSVSRHSFPGYLSSEAPSLGSHHADKHVDYSDINQLHPGRYGVNDFPNSGVYPEPSLDGVPAGATTRAYPSSLGDPNLIAQRWDAPIGGSTSMGVYPEPSFGGGSAGASIRDFSSAKDVPSLVAHRQDAPGISPSTGFRSEPSVGAAATIRGYSSALEVPNLVGQRRDASVGISPSAGIRPEPSIGALSAGASIKGYSFTLEDSHLFGQNQDDPAGISQSAGLRPEPNLGAASAGASRMGYSSPLEDPKVVVKGQDSPLAVRGSIPATVDEKPVSMKNDDESLAAAEESNILFVDGLPTDCTRREVGHLFRPFIGYKDIKVVHKEPRHSGDRARVMCFVEFNDSKFAMTAMQALQGYKFDDKKPDPPVLRIKFAHFPFRFQDNRDDRQVELRR